MVNIRGKMGISQFKEKIPFDDIEDIETLHECCNCEGCLCEDLCKEYEDEYFRKEGD